MSGMMMAAASAGGVSGLDPDAAAFIARFTVPPSAPRTAAINTLFLAMKSAGFFQNLTACTFSLLMISRQRCLI